jgi:hypothetical protein
MHFAGVVAFPSSRWPCWAFLWLFGLLAMFHEVLDSNFVLYVVNGLIKGENEKPRCQFFGLTVMSHWLNDVWIW